MFNCIKYVILDGRIALLFNGLNHSDLQRLGKPTSAGFVQIREIENDFKVLPNSCSRRILEATCFGESVSLKLKPVPGDERIIMKLLNCE